MLPVEKSERCDRFEKNMYTTLWDYVIGEANRGFDCLYPEVARTINFGDSGALAVSYLESDIKYSYSGYL